jgi:hypothetical protein
MARVLRIPRHDNDASFVLVHVDRSTNGSLRPLDLTLVGTEGADPYILTCKLHVKFGLVWPPLSRSSCINEGSANSETKQGILTKSKE